MVVPRVCIVKFGRLVVELGCQVVWKQRWRRASALIEFFLST